MRKDFCTFLLSICPCLREYGNISYIKHSCNNNNSSVEDAHDDQLRSHEIKPIIKHSRIIMNQPKKSIVPHVSIESPD